MDIKEVYIRELELEWAELEAQGIPTERAYNLAGIKAYDRVRDHLTCIQDYMEQKKRGN